MSISEKARELLVKSRQDSDKTQDNILERSEELLEEGSEKLLNEQARESLTKQRQHLANTQDNMLERSEEEIK